VLAGAARHASRAALFPIGVAVFLAAASAAATASRAPMASRPIVFVNAYGTYSVRSDGTGWRQLNECTLNPIATNGRQLVGGFNHLSDSSAPLVLLPADREVVNDCDSGPRDPSVLRYRLRVKGSRVTWWTGFAWSPDGRRILSVGQLGSGSSSTSRALVFNADGSGYHVLEPSLDGVQSNVSAGAWSPRGDRIVFGRTFKGSDCSEFAETKTVAIGCSRAELAVMDADGSNARSLYRPPQIESSQVDLLPAGSTLRKLPTVSYRPFALYR
jgi:hypothetical protein